MCIGLASDYTLDWHFSSYFACFLASAWQMYFLNVTNWVELLGVSERKGRGFKGKPFGLNIVLTFSELNLKRLRFDVQCVGGLIEKLPLNKGVRLCELEHDSCSVLVCSISKMENLERAQIFSFAIGTSSWESFGARSWSQWSLWDLPTRFCDSAERKPIAWIEDICVTVGLYNRRIYSVKSFRIINHSSYLPCIVCYWALMRCFSHE